MEWIIALIVGIGLGFMLGIWLHRDAMLSMISKGTTIQKLQDYLENGDRKGGV
jgi:hypothetical protein